jgi:type I restriction enzyme S subunit
MTWPTVKLGDVMTVGRGSSPRPIKDERFFTGGKIPWVKIADATASGKFIYQTNQHVNDYGASFSRKLKPGALIFPASGTLGIPRFLGVEACIHDGWLYFSDYQGIDPDWLYYRIILLKDYYEGVAYGAAIQNINTDIVRNTEIQLPDLATQRSMTAVLCAYDELIAANQRRTFLLEDAARCLYREWFVYMRFPGHESVPVKDGVPEGWAKSPLSDVAEITMGQSPESKHYNTDADGLPFHQGVSDFGHRFVTHETFTKQATRVAAAGDILCSVRAPVGRLNLTRDNIAIGRGLSAMRSRAGHQSLLLYQLGALFIEEDMIGGGAIFASVGKKELFGQLVLQPKAEIAAAFDRLVSDIDHQIDKLDSQNRGLVNARDLLLPKLMSGQVDVSSIRLPAEVAA